MRWVILLPKLKNDLKNKKTAGAFGCSAIILVATPLFFPSMLLPPPCVCPLQFSSWRLNLDKASLVVLRIVSIFIFVSCFNENLKSPFELPSFLSRTATKGKIALCYWCTSPIKEKGAFSLISSIFSHSTWWAMISETHFEYHG